MDHFPPHFRVFLCALAWLLAGLYAHAQEAVNAPPPGGTQVLPPNPLSAGAFDQHADSLEAGAVTPEEHSVVERLPVEGHLFPEVLRVSTLRPLARSYYAQYIIPLQAPVKKGDRLLVAFYARGVSSTQETGEAQIHVYVQKNTPDYPHTFDFRVSLPVKEEFSYFQIPFTAKVDMAPGEGEFGLGFGALKAQSLEVGGLLVLNYGPDADLSQATVSGTTYEGREPGAAWRAAADQRIEELRKGALTVLVVDGDDQPVTDARVEIELKRHEFAFGSAVGARQLMEPGPDGDRYRALVEELFNTVTLENDLKWNPWEAPETDTNFNRAQTFAALRWLKDRGIRVRGHVMVWPGWTHIPPRIRELSDDPVALQAATLQRIRDVSSATQEWITEWDVMNEPYDNHDLMDICGDYAMVQWFQTAAQENPGKTLFINDYGILSGGGRDRRHQDHYAAVIRYLLDGGAPVQGIGLQGHFGWDLTPPERLLTVLDRFAEFGKPLVITEYDCNITDEALQADYLRDFMTTMFSHAAVAGFVQWGFWEGRHWAPEAALYRRDWSPRRSAEVYRELVLRNWWTRDGGPTDSQGRYQTRGFLGDYNVTVSRGQSEMKTTATIRRAGGTVTVVLP